MIVLAIANHKGGVGETATAHALGTCLARDHGRRVLLVDCAPQASLTGACGVREAGDKSLAEVLDRIAEKKEVARNAVMRYFLRDAMRRYLAGELKLPVQEKTQHTLDMP